MRAVVAVLAGLAMSGPATVTAHIALKVPSTRTVEQKAGPCGSASSVRGANVTTYAPGQTITVEWDETVDHPGHYRIAFDDDGQDAFVNPSRSTDNFAFTLVDKIADTTGGRYTAQVTLPTTPCTNCTLQLMQVMTTTEPYNSFYWQCADIMIAGDVPPPGKDEPDTTTGGCDAGAGSGPGAMLLAIGMLFRRSR